ncbi:MAG: LLM class flavin-dependent oxidoreductase [Candidatus Lambdaproteobacteria bacterium]|nr:LLM class flavin-dependent oxidoreductase [Candidatus Lambdaproteobacteria bacterium]
MDIGICVATKIDEVGVVAHAENLGYSHCWAADSQMLWSDCYAYLALAAQQTRHIKLGTGVSIVGTRIAPVTAHSIATINRLAPGRTFLGVGTGHTAQRLLGQRPVKLKAYAEYLRVVRALLQGEEVEYTDHGITRPIRWDMPDWGFIDVEHPVEIYVSGFGPKAQALAGQYGDGVVVSIPPNPGAMTKAMANVRAGAEAAGRKLPKTFYSSSLAMVVVVDKPAELASERVINECGPFVMSAVHYIYDKVRDSGGEPPPILRKMWKEYTALVEQVPPERRHMRVHQGHCTYLVPEEARFVTPELIRSNCVAGTADEVLEQIRTLDGAGLHQLMLIPSLQSQFSVLENFSQKVMKRL